MESVELLLGFIKFKKTKSDLQKYFGEDLLNATCTTPVVISANDVINALTEYETEKVSLNTLVEWVNVIWFTDLFEYTEDEEDSISSVMSVLETLDEDEVTITETDIYEMKRCLSLNLEYTGDC